MGTQILRSKVVRMVSPRNPVALKETQKFFLRDMMSLGVMTTKEVRLSFQKAHEICEPENDVDISKLARFVLEIDRLLVTFGFSIKKAISDVNNSQYYMLINIDKTPFIQKLSSYSPGQKEFFHTLIDEILQKEDGLYTISMTSALNLTSKVQTKFTKIDANTFLDTLIDEKWIENVAGQIYIGPRTILEFMEYILKQLKNDIQPCPSCKILSIYGHKCAKCNSCYHRKCFDVLKAKNTIVICQKCSE